MKRTIFLAIIISTFCSVVFSQTNENICPEIKFVEPIGVLTVDNPTIFAISIGENNKKNDLQYIWTFSKGTIIEGQGTSQVKFYIGREFSGENFTAAVKITGLPKDCPNIYSDNYATEQVIDIHPIDEFGKVTPNEFKVRLDSFFSSIENNPTLEGLVFVRFDKNSSRKYKISFFRKIKNHFNFRKVDLTRVTFAVATEDTQENTMILLVPNTNFAEKKDFQIIKGEDLEQKIKTLFRKKIK